MALESEAFLKDGSNLFLDDAVAAIISLPDSRYLLQHRDDKKGIWYPNHWGFFGGAIEENESEEEALVREISEELELNVESYSHFMDIDFGVRSISDKSYLRKYYSLQLDFKDFEKINLNEGLEYKLFHKEEILTELILTPYDAFAFFLYINENRIKAS